MWKKIERAVKRLLGKALSLIELIEEKWAELPPFARGMLLQFAAERFDFKRYASEAEFWRWARQQRDSVLHDLHYKAVELWNEAQR